MNFAPVTQAGAFYCSELLRKKKPRRRGAQPGLPGSMWGNLRWGGIAHRVPYLRDCPALTTPAPFMPLSSILLSKLDSRDIVGESVSRKSSAVRSGFSFCFVLRRCRASASAGALFAYAVVYAPRYPFRLCARLRCGL